MKRIIAFLTAFVLTMSSGAALAAEPSRSAEITQRLQRNPETISVFYNGMPLEYDDVQPENIDGRVMIPFRAVLEGIGAQVDYSEADNRVTAQKGDTTISFALTDDTIYIDKNGEKSELKMDVPIVVKEGRTLVPIRFMSKAFGMNVGWDGASQFVMIIDKDELAEEFRETAPNMNKMLSLDVPEYNVENMSMKIDVDGGSGFGAAADGLFGNARNDMLDFILTANGVIGDSAVGMNAEADFAFNNNGQSVELKDMQLDIVMTGEKLYFKTNVVNKLSDVMGDALGEAAKLFSADTWYSIDLNKLVENIPMTGGNPEILKEMLKNPSMKISAEDLFGNLVRENEDVTLTEMILAASMLDTYSKMDKYVVINEKENGGYTVSTKLDENDFKDLLFSIYGHDDDEITDDIMTMMPNLNINSFSDVSPDKSEVSASIEISDHVSDMYIKMEVSGTGKIDESVQAPNIPENAVDITDMIIG